MTSCEVSGLIFKSKESTETNFCVSESEDWATDTEMLTSIKDKIVNSFFMIRLNKTNFPERKKVE